ncbi:MAG: hypothetical protein CVU44_20860 [Chloroflexi bacterium HGW-Chloroflexi-6]|nr:MAG: hypothetical protein CVU44_20860 [Chloroflexi bacterium HGW-Chloroflexi-6]
MHQQYIHPNAIYLADSLFLLERLESDSARLVYLDPPFFMADSLEIPDGFDKKREIDFDEYLDWLAKIISQAYRIIDKLGNIVIHTEPRINSYLRLIAEELFEKIELTEVILRRPKRFANRYKPTNEHETLLFCRKAPVSTWNNLTRPLGQDEIDERFRFVDSRGRFAKTDLTQPVDRPRFQYTWQGFTPPPGRSWRFSQEAMERLISEGRIEISQDGKRPLLKSYVDEFVGAPIGTNWDDLPPLTLSSSKEKTGYAAQQSLALMERVIQVASNESDIIVDPFFGSGTTIVAAHSLGRQWICSDTNPLALEITQNRLEKIGAKPSEHYMVGHEHDLNSFDIIHDSKSKIFVNILRRPIGQFLLNEKAKIEETRHYEFKEVKGNNPVSVIENASDEYAVAFLNSEGGRIFWGVRNADGVVVGVSLDYRQRDDVVKAIDMKLRQIQPVIAPSSWRIELHHVYEKKEAIPDLYVVELIVPHAPNSNILYATGKGEVHVKTDSGKKKLSYTEMLAEIVKRLNPQTSSVPTPRAQNRFKV